MSQTSIRNHLAGTVREIISDKVVSEVIVETEAGTISAVITTRSVQELGIQTRRSDSRDYQGYQCLPRICLENILCL